MASILTSDFDSTNATSVCPFVVILIPLRTLATFTLTVFMCCRKAKSPTPAKVIDVKSQKDATSKAKKDQSKEQLPPQTEQQDDQQQSQPGSQ